MLVVTEVHTMVPAMITVMSLGRSWYLTVNGRCNRQVPASWTPYECHSLDIFVLSDVEGSRGHPMHVGVLNF